MASFADYVRDVMNVLPQVNGNPMLSATSMTDDNARYREDPFYKSRAIQERDRLALEEEEKLKKEEAVQSGSGMMTGGSGSPTEQGIDPAVAAYLDAENMGARGVRNNAAINVLGSMMAGYPMGGTSGALGMTDSMGFTTAGRMNQMAYQYNKTPDFLKPYLPQSYSNAAGYINQSDSVFNPMNPNGDVTMGPQQAAMLAAQDEGLFATPEERAAWYAENSYDNGRGGGGGGYSGPKTAAEAGYSGGYM
jgi:hypothetical protein